MAFRKQLRNDNSNMKSAKPTLILVAIENYIFTKIVNPTLFIELFSYLCYGHIIRLHRKLFRQVKVKYISSLFTRTVYFVDFFIFQKSSTEQVC